MLQPNEFTDNVDSIGFFDVDYEPEVYLTLDDLKEEKREIDILSD